MKNRALIKTISLLLAAILVIPALFGCAGKNGASVDDGRARH